MFRNAVDDVLADKRIYKQVMVFIGVRDALTGGEDLFMIPQFPEAAVL